MTLPAGAKIYSPYNEVPGAISFENTVDPAMIFNRMGAAVGVLGGKFGNSVAINGATAGQDGLTTLTNTSVMDIPAGGEFLFAGWVKLDNALTTTQYLYNGVTDADNFYSLKIGFTAGQTFITMDAFEAASIFRVLIQPAPITHGIWQWIVCERGTDGQIRFWIQGSFVGKGAHSVALHAATRINIGQLNRFIGDASTQDLQGNVDDFLLGTTAIYNSDADIAVPTEPWIPTVTGIANNIFNPTIFRGGTL